MASSVVEVLPIYAAAVAMLFLGRMLWPPQVEHTAESLLADIDAPDVLKDHTQEFDIPEVVQVTDGIYMAIGFGIANSILIEGPDGAIVVDVMESMETASEVMAAFRKVTSSPIRALIYTHNHHDHIYGAAAFVDDPNDPPEIWAHHTLESQIDVMTFKSGIMYLRAARQFGPLLPSNAHINSGLGPNLRLGNFGYLPPTHLLTKERADVVIAGLNLTLVHMPGETSDHIGVWYPAKGAFMCGDNVYRTFPNLYAIRGTPSRNVLHWAESVDKIRHFKPQFLVPSHTRHLEGKDFIDGILTHYRDAIQYIHDQTLRYMNKGYYPQDIVPLVKLPEKLSKNPWLYQLYGSVEWSVRAVFAQYLGWFSGNVAELKSVPSKERAANMIELAGGVDTMCSRAKASLHSGNSQWALELATHVLTLHPGEETCMLVRHGAIRDLASQQTSANGRNYYLTVALEDYKLINAKLSNIISKDIDQKPAKALFQILRTKLIPETCVDEETTILFNFTDVEEIYTLTLRNGILDVQRTSTADWDIKVVVTLETFKDILMAKTTPVSAYVAGSVKISGGIRSLRKILSHFEHV